GSFYPGDLIELDAMVHRLLGAAAPPAIDIDLRVLIVPHAGLAYSGPVAATAYALVDGAAVRRVVLLGPSHFRGFAGLALSGQAGFATPL
ncbi:MAG: AmmeMemoRadiSam system protein B, partial [Actinobacteria bacterium]|nr:AmmeMemoRadiSam system protein B [Actinomycetota bacterium]NIS33874.1 AmmeMemoRadiSam system protein B [Actinomycetota bacterium]NIT97119.1 AmmeMemoRadiSam system protein B [Actinomycetota bacterium]NIU68694.1 AmmeMemoRadiSam system protein B [Actinomycetota bacterium]NIV57305.1 AmmeMemoRadiSam system protein B [Actinomycetota bacterium]